jgi:hypothetical protein
MARIAASRSMWGLLWGPSIWRLLTRARPALTCDPKDASDDARRIATPAERASPSRLGLADARLSMDVERDEGSAIARSAHQCDVHRRRILVKCTVWLPCHFQAVASAGRFS